MAEEYNFQYTPLTGRLPGKSFVEQTEKAINELAGIVNEGSAQVEVITNLANTANDNSEEALEKANEALETSGRVYITLPNLDDADDYFDSQLYYFANEYSANLPVQDTGFLEVKTNDTKTAAEQVFIADTTGLCYFRHGDITGTEVGDETVYSVTWETWSSALANETYVQTEVNIGVDSANDYTDEQIDTRLPLTGGNITGSLTVGDKVVERVYASGTNYIRFESGLQICWGTVAGSGNASGTTVTFPVAFNSAPVVTATANSITASPNHVSVQVANLTTTHCTVAVSVNASWSSAAVAARWIAIGYWK